MSENEAHTDSTEAFLEEAAQILEVSNVYPVNKLSN